MMKLGLWAYLGICEDCIDVVVTSAHRVQLMELK